MAAATRKPPAATPASHCDHDAVIAALARAVCQLATRLPGAPASLQHILTGQLSLGDDTARTIIDATGWHE
jgi:hypothetical protein